MEEQFRELVRVGVVTNIYPERGTVRVHLVDADDQVSYELPVIYRKTGKDKEYWMPDIGEHVVCLFSGQGMEQGFVLGAIYSQADPVPVSSKDKWHIKFEDGTWLEYDRAEQVLRVDSEKQILLKAKNKITIQAPVIRILGNLYVEGNIYATGSIIDEGGNTNHHSH